MFSICKQTHPATGIEFSITCRFFNNFEENIVTAGANILKVFRIIPDVDPNNTTEKFNDIRPPKMRLECMCTYTLYGNVMSLQSVSLSGSQRDALLISFKDAKLSVVQHDPNTFDLKTLSLHYFEEEDIKGGWTGNYHIPMVRVDPDNRCAVMVVYGKKLVVLPFRRDSSLDEIELQDVKPMKKTPVQLIAKTPILASYIITLKDLDEKIDNLIDIQFLHGYYEPTLLIVYEPVRTFPGRIAVRTDTCTMVAISLNIQQRVHPIIWTVAALPFDCSQVLAIKKPIGGCLVMSHNALIYLNQSVPPYGVSLNSIADHSTSFPLKPQSDVTISLDAAQVAFIDFDKLVLSLKGGELYVLTLCADSMRSVRSFHFSKAASSVLTSCMLDLINQAGTHLRSLLTICHEEYLFLGSRLGNSLLLRFTEKDHSTVITIDDTEHNEKDKEKDNPRKRLEEEELEVYGTGEKTSVQLTSFTFDMCDSWINIAPIGFMTIGERCSEDDKTEDQEAIKSDLEIVTSSGRGKNGTLCVLQSTIKPHIITSFGLSGCRDVWTVFDDPSQDGSITHKFMILSQESSTMILQTGDEINEIENTGFCNNQTTIYVGNLGNNRYIAQILSKSIRLLQGTRLLQNVQIDTDSPLNLVALVDPYICVKTESGTVISLALRETRGVPRLAVNKNTIGDTPSVVAMAVYKDLSGLFTKVETINLTSGNDFMNSGYMKPEPHMKIEDEEDLLYGESGNAFKVTSIVDLAVPLKTRRSDWWRRMIQTNKPTYWLFVTRINGNLEIYTIPDMKLAYIVNNVGNGNKVLSDSMEFVPLSFGQQGSDDVIHGDISTQNFSSNMSADFVKEILMVGLGNRGSRPTLFIRTETDILIYRVYRYCRGHLKIRFRKLNHNILIPKTKIAEEKSDEESFEFNVGKMRYFQNVSGYNGVLICGERPYMVLLTARGELRTHSFFGLTTMRSFAPFNNVNCPNGLIYFDEMNRLQIAIFPSHLTYDAQLPSRKVPLRCTPTFITYHKESKVYCLVTDTEEVSNKYYRFNGEDKEMTEENKGERFIYPSISKFQVVLVSPTSWEVVPKTSIELEEWEHVISFKNVHLAYEGTRSGFKEYICVGTNYNYSEDITSRGRILLYDIIQVVPEPDAPLTCFKLKEIYIKEQKGPVSAITHVLGFLVTAVGQKIYLWQLKDNDLIGVAFIDTNIYVHQMVSIKSLILVADVYKSINLLRFQEEYRTLSLVSRDYSMLNVLNIEFMVDNTNLGFLATDCNENLIIYMYQPESRDSFGGQKLLRKADYHIGQKVNAMFRIQCNNSLRQWNYGNDNKHTTYFATLDGGLGYCVPLPEKTYRRLLMLQNVLLTHIEHLCGLNPKSFRTIKSQHKLNMNPSRCIVDGDLVWSFLNLPLNEKQEVSKKIGTKISEIYADLLEIEYMTSSF